MNEKEFNLQVLAKMVEIANVIFAKLSINIEGTFTAAELWEGKNSLKENIVIDYHGTEFDDYRIEVGTFKCRLTPERVFYLVWKFEQLCHIRQEKKARFTFGEPEGETISEKAMYKSNKGEIITRKKNMVRLCDNIAYSVEKGQVNPIKLYFFAGGLWYMVGDAPDKEAMKDRIKSLKQKDFILNNLKRRPELMSEECTLSPIFKALYDVLCNESIKDTPEEKKCENEAENAVICDSERVNTSAKEFNKHEALKETEKRMREKHPDYISLIRYNGMYYSYGESAKNVRLSDGARNYITDTGDYICFPESLLDEVLTKLIKASRGVLTCDIIEDKPRQEDYPPEPYNKTGEASCNDEAGSTTESKAIRTTFARQKVFSNELYSARRKMRRYKPRYFVRYTNYHSRGESVANRTGSGKSGGYSVVTIRGSTGIKIKTNQILA